LVVAIMLYMVSRCWAYWTEYMSILQNFICKKKKWNIVNTD